MNPIFWIMLLASSFSFAAERVRHVQCHDDQIVTVHTALGIATIIQVPDRPNSVVVGDQDKFKVEYLDQAITIKPLQGGAKSNLYVYTDYRRYNVQLVTGAEAASDYVVYLENQKQKQKEVANPLRWMKFVRSVNNDDVTITTKRLGHASEGVLLIEFQVSSSKPTDFRPEWIWISQDGKTRPIQNLFLSSVNLSEPAQGTIQLLWRDIDPNRPMRIELRKKKINYIVLPKALQWK